MKYTLIQSHAFGQDDFFKQCNVSYDMGYDI